MRILIFDFLFVIREISDLVMIYCSGFQRFSFWRIVGFLQIFVRCSFLYGVRVFIFFLDNSKEGCVQVQSKSRVYFSVCFVFRLVFCCFVNFFFICLFWIFGNVFSFKVSIREGSSFFDLFIDGYGTCGRKIRLKCVGCNQGARGSGVKGIVMQFSW